MEPYRRHWVLPLRMLLAGLLITALTGGAVATAGLMQLKELETEIQTYGHEAPFRAGPSRRRPASRRRSCSSAPTGATATARTTRARTR